MTALSWGDLAAQQVSQRIAAPVATMTALKAPSSRFCVAGQLAHVLSDNSIWQYAGSSALTGDDILVATPSDSPSTGRWLRKPGACKLSLSIGFGTLDAAVLLTIPTGARLQILEAFWYVTASFTGGSSSAIGVSSGTKTSFTTKGDLLGGATGDVLAGLAAGTALKPGTVGAGFDTLAKRRNNVWEAADTVRFDRITSAFTAGAGAVILSCNLLENAGA